VFDHIDTLHVAGNEEIHPSVEKSAPTAGISLVVVGLLWSAVAATKTRLGQLAMLAYVQGAYL
jgi:hypothetical protein